MYLIDVQQTLLNVHNWYHGVPQFKANLKKSSSPIRLGILSAAAINYTAIIDPVQSHPDVLICAVAARSLAKAQALISRYGLTAAKALGSYDELLQDPDIDAVYIPLPNGLHSKWAIRAMEAGKHVLIEKPIAANAAEATAIKDCAARTGRIALEAFHWNFHPAAHTTKALIDSGEFGPNQSVDVKLRLPGFALGNDDIRFNYDLAGGSCMDLTYVFSAATYFASTEMLKSSYRVIEALPRRNACDPRIDDAMTAQFFVRYPDRPDVKCTVSCALVSDRIFGLLPKLWEASRIVVVELDRARITFDGFAGPWIEHSILVEEKDASGKLTGTKRTERAFVDGPLWKSRGERWWTSYRYQLEAFIDRIRSSSVETFEGPWLSLDQSVKLMELIDAVYERAGMPKRGRKVVES